MPHSSGPRKKMSARSTWRHLIDEPFPELRWTSAKSCSSGSIRERPLSLSLDALLHTDLTSTSPPACCDCLAFAAAAFFACAFKHFAAFCLAACSSRSDTLALLRGPKVFFSNFSSSEPAFSSSLSPSSSSSPSLRGSWLSASSCARLAGRRRRRCAWPQLPLYIQSAASTTTAIHHFRPLPLLSRDAALYSGH